MGPKQDIPIKIQPQLQALSQESRFLTQISTKIQNEKKTIYQHLPGLQHHFI